MQNKGNGNAPYIDLNELHVGSIHAGWKGAITLTNPSPNPIKVDSIKTSCECFKAKSEASYLRGGESCRINLSINRNLGQEGSFKFKALIDFADNVADSLALEVDGYFERPIIVDPPAMTLHNIVAGEKAEVMLAVRSNLPLSEIGTYVDEGYFLRTSIVAEDEYSGWLRLEWQGTNEPGWHRSKVYIVDRDSTGTMTYPVRTAVQVIQDFQLAPPIIEFNVEDEGEVYLQRVKLKSNDDLRIKEVVSQGLIENGLLKCEVVENGSELIAELKNAHISRGVFKVKNSKVILSLTDERQIELPIIIRWK